VMGGADDVSAARNAGDYAHLVSHGSRRRRLTWSSRRARLSSTGAAAACAVRSCAAAAEASGALKPMPATTAWLRMRFSAGGRLQDLVEHPPDGGRPHEEQQLAAVVALPASAATSATQCAASAACDDASSEKKAPASAAAVASVVDDDEDMDTAVFLACAGTRSETLLAAALLAPLVDGADRATILAGFSRAIVAMVAMAVALWQVGVVARAEMAAAPAAAGGGCEVWWVRSAMAS